MYRLRVFSGMPSFDIHSKRLMLWKTFQLWSCLAVNRFQGVFFFLVCVSGHIDLRQRGETKGDPLPFFLFLHSTCYLSHEQQFCLNLSSPHGKKKKKKSQSALISFSPLCYSNASFELRAISHQQNWTFTFPPLPLSLRLSFTIPLSCLFFFFFL